MRATGITQVFSECGHGAFVGHDAVLTMPASLSATNASVVHGLRVCRFEMPAAAARAFEAAITVSHQRLPRCRFAKLTRSRREAV
jgi:hypothetical protein